MNSKKHSKETLLAKGGIGLDAINYINSSIQGQKNKKKDLEQKIKDSFFMVPEKVEYDESEYQK